VKMPSDLTRAMRATRVALARVHAPRVVRGEPRRNERARSHRERLRRPGLFAGHGTLRHRALLDGKERDACLAMQDVEMSHLGAHDHRGNRLPVARDIHEDRLSRNVVVPEVAMHDLEIPDDLTRRRSERDDRVRVHVCAEPLATVVVGARSAGGNEEEAEYRRGTSARMREGTRIITNSRSSHATGVWPSSPGQRALAGGR